MQKGPRENTEDIGDGEKRIWEMEKKDEYMYIQERGVGGNNTYLRKHVANWNTRREIERDGKLRHKSESARRCEQHVFLTLR